ncbi:MAG TPA: ATP-binding protein, partial [Haliscomenobacter sp.]|nr:ATP-binding protein [Haliscomenobacter sp.]
AGLFFLLGLGAFVFTRLKEQQRRRSEALRQKIASDLHDEVGSTLSSISILSESFSRNEETSLDKNRFGNIGDKARTALDSISDIVWSVNPENDSMEKLLTRMSSYAAEMLENAGAELLFQVGENIESMALPMEKRKDFYLIFKEAIHNCAKYAQAKHIEIRLEVKNNTLHLSIKDDGIGFDPSKVENLGMGGNGLKNMQRRTAVIGGVFSIQSNPGYGVTLSVAVPLVP